MKIAHISDLHFFHFSFNPLHYFSKRILGNTNYLFSRRKQFSQKQLLSLIPIFKEENVDLVVISGDLSTTGLKKEFAQAKKYIQLLEENNLPYVIIPGNHDFYVKRDERKKTFYQFFSNKPSIMSLQKDRVEAMPLCENWYLVLMDTAFASPWFSSQGSFSKELENNFHNIMQKLPSNCNVVLINHFPLFAPDGPRKALQRREFLCDAIKQYPHIKLYLHGHSHRHSIADLRSNELPIVIDAGCSSNAERGSCNIINIGKDLVDIDVIYFQNGSWEKGEKRSFSLTEPSESIS